MNEMMMGLIVQLHKFTNVALHLLYNNLISLLERINVATAHTEQLVVSVGIKTKLKVH